MTNYNCLGIYNITSHSVLNREEKIYNVNEFLEKYVLCLGSVMIEMPET